MSIAVRPRRLAIQMLGNKRAHYTKQSAPEARQAARRAPDGRRERLRGPSIQHGIKHGLEKVLQRKEALPLGDAVRPGEQDDGQAHQGRREHHCPFAPKVGDAAYKGPEQDADDAGRVREYVGGVGKGQACVCGAVFERQDSGQIEAWEGKGETGELFLKNKKGRRVKGKLK